MKIAIIGAGPAGMMAAIAAAQAGAEVFLLEKNEKVGKKMYISGKGRCNVTNDCLPRDFLQSVVRNCKFLTGAINRFTPEDTQKFCEKYGVALKVERGNRVFPQSDKSSDVIKAFERALADVGVMVKLDCEVLSLQKSDVFHLKTTLGEMIFDKVVVATGGYSYRATGSDGFGYEIARNTGHDVVELKPALCRILCKGAKDLEGLSLKNVEVSFVGDKKVSEFGEMLFTDDGVSGPAVLSLSSQINRLGKLGQIVIDLKPALDEETLDARILRDFSERMNKDFANALDALLPMRLVHEVVRQSGIPPYKKVNQITAKERSALVFALKNLHFEYVGLDDINAGIVTSGGVDVKQINPKTMESKILPDLYFCGEVLDVDAYTGGFNIQMALSTGYVAGVSAAAE